MREFDIPAHVALCLNVSADTLVSHDILPLFDGFPTDRITLEITEHDYVPDYAQLMRSLAPLRAKGIRIAIDDAGAGYASMAHILNINPDYIKLDISLTRQIDSDRKRRALAAALIEFARQTDASIVAEGIETAEEFDALRALGVQLGQGYYISPPVPRTKVTTLIRSLEGC